jgi:hypothetical protein
LAGALLIAAAPERAQSVLGFASVQTERPWLKGQHVYADNKSTMHLLKNGHPAHVFTAEDRQKAAARTNLIRREMRELERWLDQSATRVDLGA